MRGRLKPGKLLVALILVLLILIARPVGFLMYTYYKDKKQFRQQEMGYANDASGLNKTKVDTILKVAGDVDAATQQIVALIKLAKLKGKKISIAGAQHSMGGHTIQPDGIQLDMTSFHYMHLDSTNNILHAGAGTRWSEIIPYLNKYGKSVAVMQSNNSFSIGGSISVNCHGWQPNSEPIASTVQSFRLINAEGQIINCNRDENEELFSLALGGYGLFGVILDVELKVVDNRLYTARQHSIKNETYVTGFNKLVSKDTTVGMAYGRLNINPENFLEEALIYTFHLDSSSAIVPLKENSFKSLRRTVFRSSAKSDYGKNLRWKMEKLIGSQLNGRKVYRNQLLNEGVEVFRNGDTAYTDILHEYFIPKDSVEKFIAHLKTVLPSYNVDLLNITIRNVKADSTAFLKYANEEVFAFVMLFNQKRNVEEEKEMALLTQKLINISLSMRGTYYLPYRLHATKDQMYRAYPQVKEFFLLKKKYDSEEIFSNSFYQYYK